MRLSPPRALLCGAFAFAIIASLPSQAHAGTRVRFSLHMAGKGSGSARITWDKQTPVECPPECLVAMTAGDPVNVQAKAAQGSYFAGWTEPCAGLPENCDFTIQRNTSLTATFQKLPALTVSTAGKGTGHVRGGVPGAPPTIDCPTECLATYAPGSKVTLHATPDTGSVFESWSGACAGTLEDCTVTMSQAKSVRATFRVAGKLVVSVVGDGTVTSDPPGIECPTECLRYYAPNTKVTLTARPGADYRFKGWTGDTGCSGSAPTCTVNVVGDKQVTATFVLKPPAVSLPGDFNGDGRTDFVTFSQATGLLRVGLSDGAKLTFTTWGALSGAQSWVDVQAGDVNGDGIADVVARARDNGQWWAGVSNGINGFTISLWDTWSPAADWVDVRLGDLNGDGKADLIGRVRDNGQWWGGISNGARFTTSLWDAWSPALTWVDVQVGDVNGDGKADIAGRVKETGQWWVSRSTGAAGATSLWDAWSPSATWVDVRLGDVNGDGRGDLLGRVKESGQWWVSRSSGDAGATTLWDAWSPGATWVDVLVADFSGDGLADIAGRVKENGQWWVSKSDASRGVTTQWATWSPAIDWVAVRAANVNGDGRSDIAGVAPDGTWTLSASTGHSFTQSHVFP
jgi:hypothetical protein